MSIIGSTSIFNYAPSHGLFFNCLAVREEGLYFFGQPIPWMEIEDYELEEIPHRTFGGFTFKLSRRNGKRYFLRHETQVNSRAEIMKKAMPFFKLKLALLKRFLGEADRKALAKARAGEKLVFPEAELQDSGILVNASQQFVPWEDCDLVLNDREGHFKIRFRSSQKVAGILEGLKDPGKKRDRLRSLVALSYHLCHPLQEFIAISPMKEMLTFRPARVRMKKKGWFAKPEEFVLNDAGLSFQGRSMKWEEVQSYGMGNAMASGKEIFYLKFEDGRGEPLGISKDMLLVNGKPDAAVHEERLAAFNAVMSRLLLPEYCNHINSLIEGAQLELAGSRLSLQGIEFRSSGGMVPWRRVRFKMNPYSNVASLFDVDSPQPKDMFALRNDSQNIHLINLIHYLLQSHLHWPEAYS